MSLQLVKQNNMNSGRRGSVQMSSSGKGKSKQTKNDRYLSDEEQGTSNNILEKTPESKKSKEKNLREMTNTRLKRTPKKDQQIRDAAEAEEFSLNKNSDNGTIEGASDNGLFDNSLTDNDIIEFSNAEIAKDVLANGNKDKNLDKVTTSASNGNHAEIKDLLDEEDDLPLNNLKLHIDNGGRNERNENSNDQHKDNGVVENHEDRIETESNGMQVENGNKEGIVIQDPILQNQEQNDENTKQIAEPAEQLSISKTPQGIDQQQFASTSGENYTRRTVSARRSIRPLSGYDISRLTYREAYHKNYDSDQETANSSLNVTIGSDIPTKSSFKYLGYDRKRNNTLDISVSRADSIKVASPKRSRISFSGLFGIVASPMTSLKSRLSRTKIRSSTPMDEENNDDQNELEYDVNIENGEENQMDISGNNNQIPIAAEAVEEDQSERQDDENNEVNNDDDAANGKWFKPCNIM